MSDAAHRREELKAVWEQASACQKCPQLASTRQTVVFGAGNADADLMFVGEAPGAREDERGLPFVGQAGRLLDQLLGEIGLERGDVFVANVLKCRPPGNRDPLPQEIDNCQDYLFRQLELIRPKVVCTPRELLDEAAARRPHRHHAPARPRRDPHDRPAHAAAVPDLPPGGGALHAADARDAARGLRAPAGAAGAPAPPQPEPPHRRSPPCPSRSCARGRGAAEPRASRSRSRSPSGRPAPSSSGCSSASAPARRR